MSQAQWRGVPLDPNPSQEKLNDTTTEWRMAVHSVAYSLAASFVFLRVYVRTVMTKAFGVDDGVLVFTLAVLTTAFICNIIKAYNGLGKHVDLIPFEQAQTYRLANWIDIFTCALGLLALKTAIGLNLLRVCNNIDFWPWYKRVVWATLGLIWIYTCVWFGHSVNMCKPLRYHWDATIKGTCLSVAESTRWGTVTGVINTSSDVIFAVLPVPLVWKIKLPLRVRIYLVIILSLGFVTVMFGVVRMISIQTYATSGASKDSTYHISPLFWTYIELCVGIITASCVPLKPLVNKIFGLNDTMASKPTNGSGPFSKKTPRGFMEIKLDTIPDGDRLELGEGGSTTSHVQGKQQRKGSWIASPEATLSKSFYDDAGSEDAIVPVGITKTTQFSVARSSARG